MYIVAFYISLKSDSFREGSIYGLNRLELTAFDSSNNNKLLERRHHVPRFKAALS